MLYNSRRVITLARKLRVVDYFALGWGTMVGVGWLVLMDDWLLRGGVLVQSSVSQLVGHSCCPSATCTANWLW
jgi:hypothetical protein